MTIATRIRQARTSVGMSQRELADVIGLDRGVIARWESGEIQPLRSTLASVARATNSDLRWLIFGETTAQIGDDELPSLTQFWMVHGIGQRGPAYRHLSRDSAEREAKRLAVEHPEITFVVLETCAAFKAERRSLQNSISLMLMTVFRSSERN